MGSDDRYNGWTNRETWAVALYINNDEGWQESVLEELRQRDADLRENYDGERLNSYGAGELIRENVEQVLWGDHVGDTEHVNEAVMMAIEDIGSLWRVNWTELGAAFLEDLEDN